MRFKLVMSMVALAATFYVSAASAESRCSCEQSCTKQFSACKADELAQQHSGELACRQAATQGRMSCKVQHASDKRSCASCGEPRVPCMEQSASTKEKCTSGLNAERKACLNAVKATGSDAVKQCMTTRDQCMKACP